MKKETPLPTIYSKSKLAAFNKDNLMDMVRLWQEWYKASQEAPVDEEPREDIEAQLLEMKANRASLIQQLEEQQRNIGGISREEFVNRSNEIITNWLIATRTAHNTIIPNPFEQIANLLEW